MFWIFGIVDFGSTWEASLMSIVVATVLSHLSQIRVKSNIYVFGWRKILSLNSNLTLNSNPAEGRNFFDGIC